MNQRFRLVTLVFFLFFSCVSLTDAAELQVFFLNVGKGDAIYIETPKKEKILIDSGNLITGYQVVTFLKNRGVKKLDQFIITHPHPDHMGGVFHVLQHLEADIHYDNGQFLGKDIKVELYRWYAEIFRTEKYKVLKADDKIVLGEVTLDVLSPVKHTSDWNTNSLVIRLTYGKTSFLLMGDANIPTENELLKRQIDLKANVIKVGRHGAKDATSEKFLKAVSPEYSVISAPQNTSKRYCDPMVIQRLIDIDSKLLITARDNNVIFKSDGGKITLVK